MLGAAETVVGLTDSFRPLPDQRGLYVVNPQMVSKTGKSHRVLRSSAGDADRALVRERLVTGLSPKRACRSG